VKDLSDAPVWAGGDDAEAIRAAGAAAELAEETPLSEDQAAAAFTARYGAERLFDHGRGRWLIFDGARFAADRRERVADEMRDVVRAAALDRQVTGPAYAKIGRASFVRGALALAAASPAHAITGDELDAEWRLIGTPAGPFDVASGLLLPASPHDRISKIVRFEPLPDVESARPVRWLQFLDETFGNNWEVVDYLQAALGYALTGSTKEQKLFFFFGSGGNGKSVLLDTVAWLAGDYSTVASMETFSSAGVHRHPAELAALEGARLVLASENEATTRLAEARIKSLTGGEPITARLMRQNPRTFRPAFKLFLSGNHRPRLDSVDDAIRRRVVLVPFEHRPARPDPDLAAKLRAEGPEILSWLLAGALRWHADGLGQPPEAVTAATADYLRSEDTLGEWLEAAVLSEPGAFLPSAAAFKSWSAFAAEAGERAGNAKAFAEAMARHGHPVTRQWRPELRQQARGFDGLALRAPLFGDQP
jgi:putative DNA primase/helicase